MKFSLEVIGIIINILKTSPDLWTPAGSDLVLGNRAWRAINPQVESSSI